MKSKIAVKAITVLIAMLASAPAFGGPSVSIGLGMPAAIMYESAGRFVIDEGFPLPLADIGFSYRIPLGASPTDGFSLGIGARAICYLIGTSFGGYVWPDVAAEWRWGALVAAARLGGGAIAGYSDSGFSFLASPVFFPDLSLWWALGRRGGLRLGGGVLGKVSLPGSESTLGGLADGLILYAGFKAVLGR